MLCCDWLAGTPIPYRFTPEVHQTREVLPLHAQGPPFWFSYYLMTECCHLMPENCGCFKCHTALWLADGISWHPIPCVLRKPCDWLAGRIGWQDKLPLPLYLEAHQKRKHPAITYKEDTIFNSILPHAFSYFTVTGWQTFLDTVIHPCSQAALSLVVCFLWTKKCSNIK